MLYIHNCGFHVGVLTCIWTACTVLNSQLNCLFLMSWMQRSDACCAYWESAMEKYSARQKWHLCLFWLERKHTTPAFLKSEVVSMDFRDRNRTNQFLACKADQDTTKENTATSKKIALRLYTEFGLITYWTDDDYKSRLEELELVSNWNTCATLVKLAFIDLITMWRTSQHGLPVNVSIFSKKENQLFIQQV